MHLFDNKARYYTQAVVVVSGQVVASVSVSASKAVVAAPKAAKGKVVSLWINHTTSKAWKQHESK